MLSSLLDVTPLNSFHALLFLLVFALTYIVLYLLVSASFAWLRRPAAADNIKYVGPVIIAAGVFFASFFLQGLLLLGLVLSAALLIIIGTYDEYFDLPPAVQLLWQAAAVLIAVLCGWMITYITNPWEEGVIFLSGINLAAGNLPAIFLTTLWLIFLMNALNWLDGSDGLAASVSSVAFIMLVLISLLPSIQDSRTVSLSLIGAGISLSFLLWNWPPAKAYLGTSGSWFLGLYLGLVALSGGGKVVTTLLILAWPAFDALLVVSRRFTLLQPPWQKNPASHLHYRLRRLGFKPSSVAILAALVTAGGGVAALLMQTHVKIWLLGIIALVLVLSVIPSYFHK
jgi:UDP-GlcNAc:undecaprenyl-phosphate/decaprenyl-phosphate GlcNAc-1-phosphate transferase